VLVPVGTLTAATPAPPPASSLYVPEFAADSRAQRREVPHLRIKTINC
jgi:hypothetical protein